MRRFRLFVGAVYFLAVIQYTVLLRHPIHLSQSPCGERVGVSNSSIRSTFILLSQGGAGAGIFYYEKIPGSKYILAVLLYHGGSWGWYFLIWENPWQQTYTCIIEINWNYFGPAISHRNVLVRADCLSVGRFEFWNLSVLTNLLDSISFLSMLIIKILFRIYCKQPFTVCPCVLYHLLQSIKSSTVCRCLFLPSDLYSVLAVQLKYFTVSLCLSWLTV